MEQIQTSALMLIEEQHKTALLETKIAAMESADAEKETKGIPGDKPQE